MLADKNDKGEFALYDQGKLIGYSTVEYIDGAKVVVKVAPMIKAMKEAAKKDGINLTLASGLRTFSEQLYLRQQNAPPNKKADNNFLMVADSTFFAPFTGKPGYSNHQDGLAYDFNVTGFPQVYAWLVKNAYQFGFIRTVKTERWHWEYMPGTLNPFWYVGPTDPSWDGLASTLAKSMVKENPGKISGTVVGIIVLAVAAFFF